MKHHNLRKEKKKNRLLWIYIANGTKKSNTVPLLLLQLKKSPIGEIEKRMVPEEDAENREYFRAFIFFFHKFKYYYKLPTLVMSNIRVY